jgi:hypothetical protein
MKLQDLSEGDSITIDCEPLSGRSWKVIESTVVDIGIAQYPLVAAVSDDTTVRLTEMDGGGVEAVTENSMNHITYGDLALHNS